MLMMVLKWFLFLSFIYLILSLFKSTTIYERGGDFNILDVGFLLK